MTHSPSPIVRFAMENGALLAAYFILKFAVTVFSLDYTWFTAINALMMIGIPIIIYRLVKRFRDEQFQSFSFSQGFAAAFMLLFFASLPEALCQYLYIEFINPQYIETQLQQVSQALETFNEAKNSQTINELLTAFDQAQTPSSIQMAFQTIFNNLYLGSLIAIVIGFITKRNPQ